jgi:hypothetical protein
MISRRDFLGTAVSLASVPPLLAQDPARAVFWVKLSVTVTGRMAQRDVLTFSDRTRYINGLVPADFRVFEDGIPQEITAFAEGGRPPQLVDPKATSELGRPGIDLSMQRLLHEEHQQAADVSERIRKDLDNSYTVTYFPDSSNQNEGFRQIKIEIVPDVAGNWRVTCSSGYRPRIDLRGTHTGQIAAR